MTEPPVSDGDTPVDRLDRLRAQLRDLGTDDPKRAHLVLEDQTHGWRSGKPLPADVYLDLLGAANTFCEDGFDLVYGEWELRRERGEMPDLAAFQVRFPAYAEALQKQVRLDEHFTAPPALFTGADGSGASGVDPARELTLPAAFGRYQIRGEIARGGMGLVYRGHDPTLDRELAVKVLLDHYRDQPDMVRRFLTEARICSQLQHPGIVPLHDIGTMPDGRLFFAMKLVEGTTLADLLAQRTDPQDDRPRFLKVVEQVSQAVAYAHSKGVLHRDLKPANIMVGAFGEVLVMDWGLAKVTGPGAERQGSLPPAVETGAVLPHLPEGAERQTQAGTTLGTPAYIAPEQARGEIDRLDERADVFGLGAILCEVLTGRPPYTGSDNLSILYKAAHGELAEAFARLDSCGADPELIALARRCLAAARDERPRTATEVAQGLTDYLAGVEARLRRAELVAAEAAVRLREQRKRLRLLAMSAGLVLLLLGSVGWVWQLKSWQAAKDAEVEEAVAQAEPEALRLADAGRYGEAEAVVQRLEGLIHGGAGGRTLSPHAAQLRADLDMLRTIDSIREETIVWLLKGRVDHDLIATRYQEAFRHYGLDVAALEPAEAAGQLHSRAISDVLLAAVEHWRRATADATPTNRRLGEILSVADPDPESFYNRWRAAAQKKDHAALLKLTELPEVESLPPVRLALMGDELAVVEPEAIQLLQKARDRYPSDFWFNFWLSFDLWRYQPARKDEAIRFAMAAQALRPQIWIVSVLLATLYQQTHALDDAIPCWQRAIALNPNLADSHFNLGACYWFTKNPVKAIPCYRAALRVDPQLLQAHWNLGVALDSQSDRDEAIACYRAMLQIDPKHAEALINLGDDLVEKGKLDEAIQALRQAVTLPPRIAASPAPFYASLSRALCRAGEYAKAVAAARKAIELDPKDIDSSFHLANALARTGQFTEALTSYRRAEGLSKPKSLNQEKARTAIRRTEQFLRAEAKLPAILKGEAKPADAEEQLALAQVCLATQRYATSTRFYAAAFAAKPDLEQTEDRCHAAYAAAQAGSGRSEDIPKPDAREQARWRQQAIQWLRAELDFQRKQLASGKSADRYAVQKTLRPLLRRPELAGVRDDAELQKLSEAERAACRKLWADMAAQLAEADPPDHGSANP